MRLFSILLLACVLAAGVTHASEPAALFGEAARLYDAGKFAEARDAYSAMVSTGNYSANLFYDLGNAWLRLGDPGQAILNYERALALEPSHPEARANLDFVREQTGARIPQKMWLDYLTAPFDINTLTVAAAIAAWLILFVIAGIWMSRRPNLPLLCAVIILGFVALGAAGVGIAVFERDKSVAVVTGKEAEARLEPLDNSALAETLPPGSEVRILSDRGPWLYCSLPDDSRGWLPSQSVGLVRLPRS